MQRDPHFRIVIALDLSEYAEIVLEYALDQAARHSAPDMHFVHVIESDREEDLEAAKANLAALARDALEVIRDKPNWRARLHIRAGKPHVEVVALAGDVDAHLIVCGRFGVHRTWRRHGTIARRIVEDATCPVLAVNLVDRPVETEPQCPACVAVRAESDGERWFCDAHAAPDRETLATTYVLPSTIWTGGTTLW
jgi:nucleotide-binding universal stress UspA family protein